MNIGKRLKELRKNNKLSMDTLVEKLNKNGVNAIYLKTFEEARDYIFETSKDKDTIITTGCGNPHELARMIVEDYK